MNGILKGTALVAVAWLGLAGMATAQDLGELKVAIGQGGKWDASITELGKNAGIFEKNGLEVDILYTQGGGETQQVVISGSADIGIAVGTQGVMGAFSKGAPLRIIGSAATGDDAFYFVLADSPINKMTDMKGGTLAYSRNGSSTHSFALGFVNLLGVDAELVPTGGPPSTLIAVMTGQVDVGWSAPPFALKQLEAGEVKIVGTSRELPSVKDHTVRLIVVNARVLEERPEAIAAFMKGYRETIEWMYTTDEALEAYAVLANVDVALARRIREEFDIRDYVDPDQMKGVGDLMAEAVKFKYISEPLTDEQLNELILIEGWEK